MPQVGQIMASVGVPQSTAMWVEDGVEAGDEHVGRDVCTEDLVGFHQRLPRRRASLGNGAKDALGVGHQHGCRYPLAGDVADDETQVAIRQLEEVVEVAAHLTSGLIVFGDLPAVELRYGLRKQGLLDAP